jgi:hypothetical protein
MRTFAILLVLANLGFLGWNLSRPQDAERPVPSPAFGQLARPLQLLDEVEVTQQVPQAAEPQSCIALGIFNNTDESDFLVSALQERGMQARVELLQAGETRSFRVYMPPFNSNTTARQTLEALQADGVDSFIITSGALSGGISAGLFSQEALALSLQESLAAQGYATSIQEVVTASNEIWVTIEGLSQSLLEGSDLLDLLSEGLELEVIEKPCETIASSP